MKANYKNKKPQAKPKELTEICMNEHSDDSYSLSIVGHNSEKICAAISFGLVTLANMLEKYNYEGKLIEFEHSVEPGNSHLSFKINKEIENAELEVLTSLNTILCGFFQLKTANFRKVVLTGSVFGGNLKEQYENEIALLKQRETELFASIENDDAIKAQREETERLYQEFKKAHPGHGTDPSVAEKEMENYNLKH